jgi:hypothetical protein
VGSLRESTELKVGIIVLGNVEETKLINIDLIQELEELRHENKNLLTTIDGLVEEKKMLEKEIHEIRKDLINDRLNNKKLTKQLDKSNQELNKPKLEFGEEKVINQQLINNQRELMDQVKKDNKVKKCFFFICISVMSVVC